MTHLGIHLHQLSWRWCPFFLGRCDSGLVTCVGVGVFRVCARTSSPMRSFLRAAERIGLWGEGQHGDRPQEKRQLHLGFLAGFEAAPVFCPLGRGDVYVSVGKYGGTL